MATLFCRRNMLLEHVFESRSRHCAISCIEEDLGYGSLATYRKPRPKISTSSFPNWKRSFASPFPENANGRLRFQGYIFDFQANQLRDPESCNKANIQHGAITDAKPGARIRYV